MSQLHLYHALHRQTQTRHDPKRDVDWWSEQVVRRLQYVFGFALVLTLVLICLSK